MMEWLIVLAVVAVAAVAWLYRGKGSPEPEQNKPAPTAQHRAVTVKPCAGCCQAVKRIRGRRYLANQAPTLPLDGCTSGACSCSYVHYEDRREDVMGDRRVMHGIGADLMLKTGREDCRSKAGRRRHDAA
jgi:hypothetical protein